MNLLSGEGTTSWVTSLVTCLNRTEFSGVCGGRIWNLANFCKSFQHEMQQIYNVFCTGNIYIIKQWIVFCKMCTHILIGGLVGADQVGMEAWEAHYWPHREETHNHLQHSDSITLRNDSLHWFSFEVIFTLSAAVNAVKTHIQKGTHTHTHTPIQKCRFSSLDAALMLEGCPHLANTSR